MKTIYFCDDFDSKAIGELISKLDGEEKVVLYLTSNGGEVRCCHVLLDYFEREGSRIELIGVDLLASSAFRFFFEAKCSKKRVVDCLGIFHFWRNSYTINSKGKPEYLDEEFFLAELKKGHGREIEWAKSIGFNAKEMAKYMAGKDVYFSSERMKELLNNNP